MPVVRIGITDYAQNSLGDIVFVQMPEPGTTIEPGESIGEVESTKSVSDIFAPVSGTVVGRNDALDAAPELVNSDPYGDGWMIEVELAEPGAARRPARRRRATPRRSARADEPRRLTSRDRASGRPMHPPTSARYGRLHRFRAWPAAWRAARVGVR